MGKAPAEQFYWADVLRAPDIMSCCASTRGIWFTFLCFMWYAKDRGELTGETEDLCRLAGCSKQEFDKFIFDNERYNFAHVTKCNNFVTIRNRRMYREEQERKKTRDRVRKHREQKEETEKKQDCNTSVTLPSSSSSSSSTSKRKKVKKENPPALQKIMEEIQRIEGWQPDYKKDEKLVISLREDFTDEVIVSAAKDLSVHQLDKPSKSPRASLRNYCRKHVDWHPEDKKPMMLKIVGADGEYTQDQIDLFRRRDMIEWDDEKNSYVKTEPKPQPTNDNTTVDLPPFLSVRKPIMPDESSAEIEIKRQAYLEKLKETE